MTVKKIKLKKPNKKKLEDTKMGLNYLQNVIKLNVLQRLEERVRVVI